MYFVGFPRRPENLDVTMGELGFRRVGVLDGVLEDTSVNSARRICYSDLNPSGNTFFVYDNRPSEERTERWKRSHRIAIVAEGEFQLPDNPSKDNFEKMSTASEALEAIYSAVVDKG